jgi:hypothetical protein
MPMCNFVNLYYITWRHIQGDSVHHNRCEKLKCRIIVNILLLIIIIFTVRHFVHPCIKMYLYLIKSSVAKIFLKMSPTDNFSVGTAYKI